MQLRCNICGETYRLRGEGKRLQCACGFLLPPDFGKPPK